MREFEQKCGGCAWFNNNPNMGQMDYSDPYGFCEAKFTTSTRPHLPDARFEGLAILAEKLVLNKSRSALYALFGEDNFTYVETEFTKRLSVGTFSSQSCHERDDRGSLLFTPK